MRIILKPMGAVLTVGVLGALCYTALHYQGSVSTRRSDPSATANGTMSHRRIDPKDGLQILSDDPGQWHLVSPSDTIAALDERENLAAPAGHRELVFTVHKRPIKMDPWLLKIQRPLSVPILIKDEVVVEFWGRSAQPGKLTILFAKTGDTEINLAKDTQTAPDLFQELTLTPQWKHYILRLSIKQDYPAFVASLQFQPDHNANTFELTQIMATDFGPTEKK